MRQLYIYYRYDTGASMVLYKDDIRYYPQGIYDYQTPNKSFLNLAAKYNALKIKNCGFLLFLSQPELQGIDPHSENLTIEQKAMIVIECKMNVWYFLREVVRIAPNSGDKGISYIANRGNIALTWCFLNGMDFALIQPRQTGKSVSTDCIMLWLMFFVMQNSVINLITKDSSLRDKNVIRLKKMRNLLPAYLNFHQKGIDSDNQNEITCKALENIYTTNVAQKDERSANNLGRGLSTPVTHIDEGPFISYISVTLPAALAAGGAARDEAFRNGLPNGNIFTTTAGKKDDRDGKYMHELISRGAVWDEKYFDLKDRYEFHRIINNICRGSKSIINGTFSHRQLGYTDEWLYRKMRESNAVGEEADRDFLNIWTSGTQKSPLPTHVTEMMRNNQTDPLYTEITKEGYVIRWYITEEDLKARQSTTKFIVGMDTSDAIGRDAIGMVFVDVRDLSVVGTMSCNQSSLVAFSNTVCNMMLRYPNLILIPEKKSSAQTFIDALWSTLPLHGQDPFKRIYNRIVDDAKAKPNQFQELYTEMHRRPENFYEMRKGLFGFNTDGSKRNTLYSSVFLNACYKTAALMRDKTLIGEVVGLSTKNGRIDHSNEGNDDHVIAWLLCHWFITHGSNLEYYGISPRIIESIKYKNGVKLDEFETYEAEEQERYQSRLDTLVVEYEATKDRYKRMEIEKKISFFKSKIKTDDSEINSLDKLININSDKADFEKRISSNRFTPDDMEEVRKSPNHYGSDSYMRQMGNTGYTERFNSPMNPMLQRSSIRASSIDFF